MADVLTKKQRSYCMSQIRCKDTSIEVLVSRALKKQNFSFKTNVNSMPGRPDIVFKKKRIVIFIDGDFWHGWQFTRWQSRLNIKWQEKIARNRKRDRSNILKLRRAGWTVLRVWEHEIEKKPQETISKILTLIEKAKAA